MIVKTNTFLRKQILLITQVNNFQKNDIVLEQNIKREDNLGAVASEKSQTSDIEERGSYIDVI